MDERSHLRDVRPQISYTIGLLVTGLFGMAALLVAQAWWWAAFCLFGVFLVTFELRRLRRKKEKIRAVLEPREG